MHQFLILALFIALFAFDGPEQPVLDVHQRTVSLTVALGFSTIALLLISAGLLARRQVSRRTLLAPPGWFYRLVNLVPMLVLLWYLAILALGWLSMLREQFPLRWLLPEIVTITLPILLISGAQASVIWVRQSTYDAYLKLHPDAQEPPGYEVSIVDGLTNYLRHHVAVIAGPLLLVVGWQNLVSTQFAYSGMEPLANYAAAVSFIGTLAIIVAAPLLIVRIWDTAPLPQGPLNEMLQAMCRQYKVHIAQLLIWHTRKTMINAAVLGFTGRFRFILLTDELINKFSPLQIQAVMAHEIAHIRLRHIPWLMASGLTLLIIGSIAAEAVVRHALPAIAGMADGWPDLHEEMTGLFEHENFQIGLGVVVVLGMWVPAFGWVSRRFERQADTFAVEHLAGQHGVHIGAVEPDYRTDSPDAPHATDKIQEHVLIRWADKDVMSQALGRIAALNAIPPDKPSWRHGSMKWRMDYLDSLEGKPVGTADVHRTIALIKLATIAVLMTVVAVEIALKVYSR